MFPTSLGLVLPLRWLAPREWEEGEVEREREPRLVEGSTSFFCLEAGRISSRSTGTPRETRKSRLMRERSQLGGESGGGVNNWA